MKCINCNKEYIIPKEGNWKKDGTIGKGHGSINSKRFCCFKCGQEYSQNKRKNKWISPFADPKVRDKAKKTIQDKYNCNNVFQNSDIKNKIKQTNLNKYGKENPAQVQEIKDKIKETNKKLYGGTLFGSESIKKKILETNLKKYNTPFPQQIEEIKEKARKTNISKYNVPAPMMNSSIKEKSTKTINEKYNVDWNCMLPQCKEKASIISEINKDFKKQLEDRNIKVELEKNITGHSSFDLYIPDQNLLIDINPTISHQSTKSIITHFGTIKPRTIDYHFKKLELAHVNNYNCIMIWDWDDKLKIINNLQSKVNIYARTLIIKEIPEIDCNIFLNTYHYQNTCKNQTIRLGLYNKDNTLLQLITFGKPRYNKNYEYELLRLCTNSKYNIIGGVNKLFNYFINNYNPSSIISYCDNSKFKGFVYTKLGFNLITKGNPNKHWYNPKTKKHITNNLLLQRGFSQLHSDSNYKLNNKGDNNIQLMLNAGYLEIYDCGQSTYTWIK